MNVLDPSPAPPAPPAPPSHTVPGRLAHLVPVLREVGDLKRVRGAGWRGSVAERAFRGAWADLVRGAPVREIADRECAAAVAGARLAGVDARVLRRCGLSPGATRAVLRRSVAEHAGALGERTLGRLLSAVPLAASQGIRQSGVAPRFAEVLCDQPRAGATCPGRARVMAEPPESHGDHCWAVAVYGALLADLFDADPADAFLLGLGHHLHNVVLPDAGFAGEMLLGDELTAIVDRLTREQLARMPGALAERLAGLLAGRGSADDASARAFHAADVLDRILQVLHHERAAAYSAVTALDDLHLVHASPVSAFHTAVLDAAGLG
ncbi:hypothetical protein ACFWN1_08580 [Streptomyces sp. NPDC058459]|uniref:hypothetical protein n=1 Tax=Streptomyces sp. NPDC058459 TaxID=3346508 RepID=UPI00364D331E